MSAVLAPPEPVLDAAGFQRVSGATDAQMRDLEAFRALLESWNEKMNLVGPSAMADFWGRHVWDSAQLLTLEPEAKTFADVGAGAGFPGLVLAILLKETDGGCVHLIESMTKRCRFLGEAVAKLELPAKVHNDRAESLDLTVDIVTARACAPLPRLLGYARPYLKRGAKGVFLKGQDVGAEIEEAARSWVFQYALRPSLSDPLGQILTVEGAPRER